MRQLTMALGLFLLFSLQSCGSFSALSEGIGQAREVLGEIHETYQELKPSIDKAVESGKKLVDESQALIELMQSSASDLKEISSESFAEADADGSGDLDWKEMLAFITLLGGGGAEYLRRKLKKLGGQAEAAQEAADGAQEHAEWAQSSADEAHDRVAHERDRRKQLEGKVSGQES